MIPPLTPLPAARHSDHGMMVDQCGEKKNVPMGAVTRSAGKLCYRCTSIQNSKM